jgi:hypothetical protein
MHTLEPFLALATSRYYKLIQTQQIDGNFEMSNVHPREKVLQAASYLEGKQVHGKHSLDATGDVTMSDNNWHRVGPTGIATASREQNWKQLEIKVLASKTQSHTMFPTGTTTVSREQNWKQLETKMRAIKP